MRQQTNRYIADTCDVTCEDNGRTAVAELLSFQEGSFLSVSLNRSVKLTLQWNGTLYEGKSSGLSFVSNGPSITTTYNGR